jgi:cellulose synthase/poly-beta-1,6-N-acetylglucosamine synthase-like glycosyltransferase
MSSNPQILTGLPTSQRIAALIPAFNEEPVLEGTIAALLMSGLSREDIYVADDRSTDRTVDIARRMGVHVYTGPSNVGKARAQVAALHHFGLYDQYAWIVFLDGDTKVDVDFMREMRAAMFQRPDASLFIGQVRSAQNHHVFSALRSMEYAVGHDLIKQGQSNCGVILVSPGCASMYRTSLLRHLHIDHSTLAEDMDLTVQAHRRGEPMVYVPSALVDTQDPGSFKDYYKQILRWNRGFWQVVKKHGFFSLTSKKQCIDLYVAFLVVDALFFNKLVVASLIALTHVSLLPYAFAVDVCLGLCLALYGACRTRRADVIYKYPCYYWMSYVNYFAFLSAMVDVVVLGKTKMAWNKVKRYEFDSPASQPLTPTQEQTGK